MSNEKYESRVREIAEEMAKDQQLNRGALTLNSHNMTFIFLPAARIAVKHMAELYHKERIRALMVIGEKEDEAELLIQLEQQHRGLIPSPDQPEGTGK